MPHWVTVPLATSFTCQYTFIYFLLVCYSSAALSWHGRELSLLCMKRIDRDSPNQGLSTPLLPPDAITKNLLSY